MEAIAFARCAVGDCKFEAANSGPSGLAFVAEAFARHAKQAHGVQGGPPVKVYSIRRSHANGQVRLAVCTTTSPLVPQEDQAQGGLPLPVRLPRHRTAPPGGADSD
jgi:hypothetical protein